MMSYLFGEDSRGMAYDEVGYHGTRQVYRDSIFQDGFLPSIGDKHWLGDGVYFFTEVFHAYKWRYDACQAKAWQRGLPFALDCCIFRVRVHTSEERVFDLTKFVHDNELKEVLTRIEALKPRTRWADKAVAEGVVLNYIFNHLTVYRNQYDVVKALFQWKSAMPRCSDAKLPADLPQMQICVKNQQTPSGEPTIHDVVEYAYTAEIPTLEALRKKFRSMQVAPGSYIGRKRKRNKDTDKYRKP